jgi:hypothetical protein
MFWPYIKWLSLVVQNSVKPKSFMNNKATVCMASLVFAIDNEGVIKLMNTLQICEGPSKQGGKSCSIMYMQIQRRN